MRAARYVGAFVRTTLTLCWKTSHLRLFASLGIFRYHPYKARFSRLKSAIICLSRALSHWSSRSRLLSDAPHRRIYFSSVIRGAAGILTAGILIALWTAAIFLRMLMIWRPVKWNFFMPVRDGFCESLQFKGVRFLRIVTEPIHFKFHVRYKTCKTYLRRLRRWIHCMV